MALAARRAGLVLLLALTLGAGPPGPCGADVEASGQTAGIGGVRLWYKVSGRGPLCVLAKVGHFPWMEQPGAFFDGVHAFVQRRRGRGRPSPRAGPRSLKATGAPGDHEGAALGTPRIIRAAGDREALSARDEG